MPILTTPRLTNRNRLGAGLLVGATMAGLAAATLTGAGSANASCVSFSGVGNTSQCNTSITIGKGSNSYAGSLPPTMPPGNAPRNQFAVAIGDHRNALNGINSK